MPSCNEYFIISENNKEDLEDILKNVQDKIEDTIERAEVEPETVVLAGVSHGGVMAMWTALNSKYELGAFFSIFSEFPVSLQEKLSKSSLNNQETPVLEIKDFDAFDRTWESKFSYVSQQKFDKFSPQQNFFKKFQSVLKDFKKKIFLNFDFPIEI